METLFRLLEPRAEYLHCMGHSLNDCSQDTCRYTKIIGNMFDTLLELSKLFKYSAKKKILLNKLKHELTNHTLGNKLSVEPVGLYEQSHFDLLLN